MAIGNLPTPAHPAQAGGCARQAGWKSEIHSRGLTLIELLVAVAILAIMILAFSTILTQCQTIVSTSQAAMRANAAAAAIAQVIRSDLRRVTKHGFLAITTKNDTPLLIVTTAGVAQSKTGSSRAMGSFVWLGLCENRADPGNPENRILWHAAWLLASSGNDPDVWVDGGDNVNLALLQTWPISEIKDLVDNINPASVQLSVPAGIGDIDTLWQVLAARCSGLSIEWTDGTLDPSDDQLVWSDTDTLWTHHDQNNWPTAIKVRFSITDPAMPEVFEAVDYEVICPIGQ